MRVSAIFPGPNKERPRPMSPHVLLRAADAPDPPDLTEDAETVLAAGRRVLRMEGEALYALAAELDDRFAEAVRRLACVPGRVVVTGMGKSGHVARKIAATLASTGTPALFVHPAEASHGDLGMVTTEDAVVALSNSGETPELADLVAYTRRFGILLVAITRNAASALGAAADLVLPLPDRAEACGLGLAPTTSTTATLALGDALAVALLQTRGFTPTDFRVYHPGGKLGARLLKVDQLMHKGDELPLVGPDTPVGDALFVMTAKRLGCVGVVDAAGRLTGIVTDGDLRRNFGPGLFERLAGAIMSPAPKHLPPGTLAGEALAFMNDHAITVVFVVEDGRPVGAVHLHDCLRAGVA